jgi:hypothetical protein
MNFEFDPSTHVYTLDDRRLISVTQALSIIDDRWKVDPFYLERGRLIHLATEYYDKDELDESTVDERIVGHFRAYLRFLDETHFKPIHIEKKLYHPKYLYATRIDRIGELNRFTVSIDLKSGIPARVDELQGAAHWEVEKKNEIDVNKVFDLYLHENGTYKLEPVENPKLLLPVFLACLTMARWKEGI